MCYVCACQCNEVDVGSWTLLVGARVVVEVVVVCVGARVWVCVKGIFVPRIPQTHSRIT